MQRLFTSINESIADFKWQKLFHERWPAYKAWLDASVSEFNSNQSISALKIYMPELLPTYYHLCDLVRADEVAACFLTGFQPPTYSSACSQAVSTIETIQLVRNYDYHAERFEGVLLKTAWNGKSVIASSDCLMGVLDGMNEDGLALSLTYGGRKTVGFGFGVPFILRYILEFCSTVAEGVSVLQNVPSHMSYNVTLVDKSGQVKTVQIAPDRNSVVTDANFTTNHQGPINWAKKKNLNRTATRAIYLENILKRGMSGDSLCNSFLHPPLYNQYYEQGLGTLYTAAYYPELGAMQLLWPGEIMNQSFDDFTEEEKLITFHQALIHRH
ncbi:C45 family autoproteolytic acyltransferase/hydolase [Algoriphagus marinus]|uniref:C45 family autoproteolytic acyltransferase/hydolase n=1 Tax=Algoriphagus marinus TaxID=1925762 RepID=UPI00094BA852|nr:C45 family peptidase [Algoriphagus marinus]